MFGVSKKLAASMAELLIILAIIGILSVMYRKTVNQEKKEQHHHLNQYNKHN